MREHTVAQEDFSAGAFQGTARQLIDSRGVYSILNGLLDEEGSVYRRGGTEYESTAAFGAGGLRLVWAGRVAAGDRVVFANPDDFGVLDGAGAPVNLGGAGLAGPVRGAVLEGLLFLPGGTVYGGSRKTADYSTGTVAVTQGSKTVTGSGTSWLANADAGMLLRLAGRYYPVASVDSNTQLTLAVPYAGATQSGQAYALTRLGTLDNHTGSSLLASPAAVAVVAGRLVVAVGGRIFFSAGPNTGSAVAGLVGALQSHLFNTSRDVHELAEGALVVQLEALRDRLFSFTTAGVFVISGLAQEIVAPDGTPQHRVDLVTRDVVALAGAGITTWRDALVVPATDDVYLLDGLGTPVPLAKSIAGRYRAHVAAGRKAGGAAVFASHYLLPILDSTNAVVDVLVGRLSQPVETRRGICFGWAFWTGHAAARALSVLHAAGAEPKLLAAGGDGRVLDLTGTFEPAAARKQDADGSVFEWSVETRDFRTGRHRNANLVRYLRAWYELEDAAADNPVLRLYVSVGADEGGQPAWNEVNWNQFSWGDASLAEFTQIAGAAPVSSGRRPFTWNVGPRLAEHVRFRVVCSDPCARLVLRALELNVMLNERPY